MKRSLAAAFFIGINFFSGHELQAQNYVVDVVLGQHSDVSKNNLEDVLDKVTAIFRDAGSNCRNMRFTLGNVIRENLPYSIEDQNALQALLARRDNKLFIVEYINHCKKYNPAAVGCAGTGTSAVIENVGSSSDRSRVILANIIAHEICHSFSLMSSVTPGIAHSGGSGSLMAPSVKRSNRNLSSQECAAIAGYDNPAYRSLPDAVVLAQDVDSVLEEEDTENEGQTDNDELIEVLLGFGAEAVPFAELQKFENRIGDIRSILLDDDQVELWPSGVVALGAIGNELDIDFLIWFYESLIGRDRNRSAERAMVKVPFAITLLAGRHKSNRGVAFLSRKLEPEAVIEDLGNSDEQTRGDAEQISRTSALGLEVSPGSEDTKMGFDNNSAMTPVDAAVAAREFGNDFLNSVQDAGRQIDTLGVEEYFGVE